MDIDHVTDSLTANVEGTRQRGKGEMETSVYVCRRHVVNYETVYLHAL